MAANLGRELETVLTKHRETLKVLSESLGHCTELAVELEQQERTEKQVSELDASAQEFARLEEKIKVHIAALESFKASALRRAQDQNMNELYASKVSEAQAANGAGSGAAPGASVQQHPSYKRFRQAVWDVKKRRAMAPVGAEEDDDVQVASVVGDLICPLTKAELVEPMRNAVCGHVYSKHAVVEYIKSMRKDHRGRRVKQVKCPVAGCNANLGDDTIEPDRDAERRLKAQQRVAATQQAATQAEDEEDVTQV